MSGRGLILGRWKNELAAKVAQVAMSPTQQLFMEMLANEFEHWTATMFKLERSVEDIPKLVQKAVKSEFTGLMRSMAEDGDVALVAHLRGEIEDLKVALAAANDNCEANTKDRLVLEKELHELRTKVKAILE